MSIRITVLTLVVMFLATYAWKNWFNALLGGIVLFAFLERPDMPRTIAGVPGLNFWNLLFLSITFAWLNQRKMEGNQLDFPRGIHTALIFYIVVMVLAALRALIDPSRYYEGTRMDLLLNYLVNPLKFLLPALMLYDGCRTRERTVHALGAILLVYFLLAVLTLKSMGLSLSFSSGDELSDRAARRLVRDVGYHRVDLSMMLSGASWALIAFSQLFKQHWIKLALFGASGITLLGQAMTGGRTGYVTWGVIGLTLCVVRWRKLLPVIPIMVAVVIAFVPAVRERMLQGFGGETGGMVEQTDASSVTSGRDRIWPLVIDEIKQSPWVGYGRNAMQRTGLSSWALDHLGEVFGHPHNAYLEYLLDNGYLGFLCGMPIYWLLFRRNIQLFRSQNDQIYEVVGGVGLALLMALLIAGVGAQTFYPREGTVPMWAALAVALRAWVARSQISTHEPIHSDGWRRESSQGVDHDESRANLSTKPRGGLA
ncbi:MAG: O-antigen ligase family protein [Verrucomicrobiota bacterium]